MDAHYDAQISRNQDNFVTHVGPARQFGSGAAGLGALAVRIGRCTLPLLKKYALPIAKKVGRNLVSAAIPEIGQMIAGKKKLKAVAKNSIKNSVSKTISDSVKPSRSRAAPKGPRSTHASGARARVAAPSVRPVAGGSPPREYLSANTREIRKTTSRKRTAKTINGSTFKNSKAKRSRTDILSNIKY